jgi:hypothetical protein
MVTLFLTEAPFGRLILGTLAGRVETNSFCRLRISSLDGRANKKSFFHYSSAFYFARVFTILNLPDDLYNNATVEVDNIMFAVSLKKEEEIW